MLIRRREPEQDQGMVLSLLRSESEGKSGVGEGAGVRSNADGAFSGKNQK